MDLIGVSYADISDVEHSSSPSAISRWGDSTGATGARRSRVPPMSEWLLSAGYIGGYIKSRTCKKTRYFNCLEGMSIPSRGTIFRPAWFFSRPRSFADHSEPS